MVCLCSLVCVCRQPVSECVSCVHHVCVVLTGWYVYGPVYVVM